MHSHVFYLTNQTKMNCCLIYKKPTSNSIVHTTTCYTINSRLELLADLIHANNSLSLKMFLSPFSFLINRDQNYKSVPCNKMNQSLSQKAFSSHRLSEIHITHLESIKTDKFNMLFLIIIFLATSISLPFVYCT